MKTLCYATLFAGARLDLMLRTRAQRLSRRAMLCAGLLTAAIAAVAYLRGADMRGVLAGSQPVMLPNVLGSARSDGASAPGGAPRSQPSA
jgi:hypothetical protein